MTSREGLQAVAEILKGSRRIAIAAHLNPDGDCIGSALAMRLILRRMGKEADVFDRDKVPDNMMFLAGADTVRPLSAAEGPYDVLLCVDCADLQRIVSFSVPEQKEQFDRLLGMCGKVVQIDHHGTNPCYGDAWAVDGDAAAACVLVYDIMGLLGVSVDREIAECLYTGISTDTGNFLQDNTNEGALRVVAAIQGTGFSQAELGRKLFAERRPAQVALISRALQTLRYASDGGVTCMTLTLADFEETGALPEDADTIVNFGRDILGVHMAMLARETAEGIKMSLRAIAPYRVNDVAKSFGGGGHAQASGCTLHGVPLLEAADTVFLALQKALEEQV